MCLPVLAAAPAAASAAASTAATTTAATAAASTAAASMSAMQIGSLALSALGAGASAYGSYQSSKAQKRAAEYNARMSAKAAGEELQSGAEEEIRHRMKVRAIEGEQIAAAAEQGLDINFGSTAQLIDETDIFGDVDAKRIRENAKRRADALLDQSGMSQMQANQINPMLSAGNTLLTKAAPVAEKYYNWKYT
jgi:hypothetical protein